MPAEGVAPQPPLFTGGGAACAPAHHMCYYMPYTAETVQPPPLDMPNVQSAYPAGFMTPPPSEISLLQQFDALPISMARRVIRDLFKKGVRSRDFLSLHVVSLEELSQSVESDRLKEVAGKSCYLALAIMTVVSQLANRKAKKVAT